MTKTQTIQAQHTPGPWTLDTGLADEDGIAVLHDGERIAVTVPSDAECERTVSLANASLIAASPELLEAAARALETLNWITSLNNRGQVPTEDALAAMDAPALLRAVIAKAEGK